MSVNDHNAGRRIIRRVRHLNESIVRRLDALARPPVSAFSMAPASAQCSIGGASVASMSRAWAERDRRDAPRGAMAHVERSAGLVMLSGFFNRGNKHLEVIMDRLKALGRDGPVLPESVDRGTGDDDESSRSSRRSKATLTFIAGPRAGERIVLEQGSVAFDRDGRAMSDGSATGVVMSIWAQGERYMLRDSAGVTVGGVRPPISVVTLDDGDEIAWGPHRLRFNLVAEDSSTAAG